MTLTTVRSDDAMTITTEMFILDFGWFLRGSLFVSMLALLCPRTGQLAMLLCPHALYAR